MQLYNLIVWLKQFSVSALTCTVHDFFFVCGCFLFFFYPEVRKNSSWMVACEPHGICERWVNVKLIMTDWVNGWMHHSQAWQLLNQIKIDCFLPIQKLVIHNSEIANAIHAETCLLLLSMGTMIICWRSDHNINQ